MKELYRLASNVPTFGAKEAILTALSLIDLALVASLVVMVIISGYENFVSKLDVESDDKLLWLVVIHLTFVVPALAMAGQDGLSGQSD